MIYVRGRHVTGMYRQSQPIVRWSDTRSADLTSKPSLVENIEQEQMSAA